MPVVHFIDVTNRDTVQAPRLSLAKLQKTMVNLYLHQLGVHQSEFAFPTSKHEANYIKANLQLKEAGVLGNLILEGWVRAIPQDVEVALETGVKDLNISISTSDQMIVHKFQGRRDQARVIQDMTQAAILAREGGIKTLGVNAEDASRTDLDYLSDFALAAKEAGANRLRYCDTLGCDVPGVIYERLSRLTERVGMPVELHCHNDLGMAVANSVAGAMAVMDAGYDAYLNVTVNGLGERAGQADLLSTILAFKFGRGMERYPIGDDLRLSQVKRLANYVARAFGMPISINQPGVGANAFAHESGIHADGALKDRRNYELYDYEILGLDEEAPRPSVRVITTGEYGGMAGFKHVYEQLGITFPDDATAQRLLELVQYANAHTQMPLTPDELRFIARYPEQVRLILTSTP